MRRFRTKPASARLRAAEYVRMSREHQRYSIANQQVAIDSCALQRGYVVGRS